MDSDSEQRTIAERRVIFAQRLTDSGVSLETSGGRALLSMLAVLSFWFEESGVDPRELFKL